MQTDYDNPLRNSRLTAIRLVAGATFAAIFAAAAWFPPGPVWGDPQAAGGVARLYPGVPASWIALRATCLCLATLAIVSWIRSAGGGAPPNPVRSSKIDPDPTVRAAVIAALVAAVLHAACAPIAGRLGPVLQTAYVAWLFVPALIFAAGDRFRTSRALERTGEIPAVGFLAVLGVVAAWTLLRFPAAQADPRSASLVDCWLCMETLELASTADFNILTDGPLPGLTSLHLVFDGAGIFRRLTVPATFRAISLLHLLWIGVGAVALGSATRRRFGLDAAMVAVAAFLFSPYLLAAPLNPCAIHFGAATAGVMLWLYVRAADDGAAWATAALGASAGLAATHPAVAPVAGLLVAATVISAFRHRGRSIPALLAAACSFVAAVGPAVPGPAELQGMLERYVGWSQGWVGIERALLGQSSIFSVPDYWGVTVSGWEIVGGALAAPFLAPRTPLRLWGDTLVEPLTTVFAAVGLVLAVVSLLRLRRDRGTGTYLPLLLFAAAVIPAFASSFDRPSLVRMLCLPAAAAWAAAFGYAALVARLGTRTSHSPPTAAGLFRLPATTAIFTLAIATSGTWIFDVVNPSILPASATAIALETAADGRTPTFTLLEHDGSSEGEGQARLEWMFVETSVAALAPSRLQTRPLIAGGEIAWDGSTVLLWSPSLEADESVSDVLCKQRPDISLFTIRDRSGISEILAAGPAPAAWVPPLPKDRWTAHNCAP